MIDDWPGNAGCNDIEVLILFNDQSMAMKEFIKK